MAMSAGIFGTAVADLSGNLVFMSAFWAWLTAQMMKYITTFYREGRWDWRVMFDSGGMPSSHTALVVGLTTGIAYTYGLGSTLFPLSLAFSLIVMYDAAGVRRHAGRQAAVLNKILENMFQNPESISADKLKEVLGHSPLQVLAATPTRVAQPSNSYLETLDSRARTSPKPYTLYPPHLFTLHPEPCKPTPRTLHPENRTLNPEPRTLNPEP
jgi:hypothetical protein